ncbi:MAG: hypothetical protein ABJA18_12870 [bacterium]
MKRILAILIFLPCLSAFALADTAELEPNPRAERFVKMQVAAGEPADLEKEFPDPGDRVLGSEFLVNLLTDASSNVHRHGVRIMNATFADDIDLESADVSHNVELSGCNFLGDLELSQSHFKKNLILDGSTIGGTLNLIRAIIDGDLKINSVKFTSVEGEADFTDLQAAGSFELRNASFAGRALFIHDKIGGNLDAQSASFANRETEISFDSMKVGAYALFSRANFSSSVTFAYADVARNFGTEDAHFTNSQTDAHAIFNSMKVGLDGKFHRTVFDCWVDFGHAEFGGRFELTEAKFNAPSSFPNFSGLKADVVDFSLAKFSNQYVLEGMEYREIKADSVGDFVDRATYSPDAYASLESFLKRKGMEGTANTLYIAQRRRERSGLSLPGKVGSVLLDVLVGYGRRPWLAFVWGALFVALGAAVFRRRTSMQPQKPEYESRHYSAFWYSLDMFLPFVDLKAADYWEPRMDRQLARTYLRIHILLGWILIPIGLAAISGLVK